MSSLQSIMNLDEDQHDTSTPMDKRDKDSATPAPGSRSQDSSTSATSILASRPGPQYSSAFATTAISTPVDERSDAYRPGQQSYYTHPGPSTTAQQGKRPTETGPAPSATSSGAENLRRQSTTSVDSMDQHGYGSAASSSSMGGAMGGLPASHLRRPISSPNPEVPVRLTPITGRVSRAKKGVPVHTCELCNPPKTFTRAEHLRRHQLSHRSPDHRCNYEDCGRVFHRLDLLTRHQQRHTEEGDKLGSDRTSQRGSQDSTPPTLEDRPSGHPVGGFSPGPSSFGGAPMSSSSLNMPPTTPDMSSASFTQQNSPAGSAAGPTMSPPPGGSGDAYGPSHGQASSEFDSPYGLHTSIAGLNQSGSISPSPEPGFTDRFMEPRITPELPIYLVSQDLPSSTTLATAPENPPGLIHQDCSPWTSASESNYSTPPEIPRIRYGRAQYNAPEWRRTTNDLLGAFTEGIRRGSNASGTLETMVTSCFVTPSYASHLAPVSHAYSMINTPLMPFVDQHTTQSMMDPALIAPHDVHQSPPVRSSTPPTSLSVTGQAADTLVTPAPLHQSIDPMAHVARQKELVLDGSDAVTEAAMLGGDGSSPSWNGDSPEGNGILTGPNMAGLNGYGIGGATVVASLPRPVRNAVPSYLEVYWSRFHSLYPFVHRRSVQGAGGEVLKCAMAAIATQFLTGKEDRIRGNQLHEYAWQEAKRAPQSSLQIMQAILLCELFARFRGRKAVFRPSKTFEYVYSRVSDQNHNMYDPTAPSSSASLGQHNSGVVASKEQQWQNWLESEAHRRLLAACFIIDNHTSIYHQQPRARDGVDPSSIPVTGHSDRLWAANSAEEWTGILESDPTSATPRFLPHLDTIRPDDVLGYTPFDQAVLLNAASLSLPSRGNIRASASNKFDDDIRTPTAASSAYASKADELLAHVFSHVSYPAADFHIALAHTPLHDLLAVSGDSWVFSQKVIGATTFQAQQKRLKAWVNEGTSSGKATVHAASALLGFLDQESHGISDYWGMYVCALIIWAYGHRRGSGSSPHGTTMTEDGARDWLRTVERLGAVDRVRGRREAGAGVVSMVKSRLEADCVGGRSRLYVDAVGVLRKLEGGVNWRWF